MEKKYPCKCCGEYTLKEENQYYICPVCNWQDDSLQFRKPDYKGGANRQSLNEARAEWKAGRRVL